MPRVVLFEEVVLQDVVDTNEVVRSETEHSEASRSYGWRLIMRTGSHRRVEVVTSDDGAGGEEGFIQRIIRADGQSVNELLRTDEIFSFLELETSDFDLR